MATLVATLGDSITAGTPAWDPDPGVREPIGTGADPRSQWQYWAHREQPRLRFRNCGVNRERTDQILARFDACARGASAIVIQGGINDIAQGIPLETAARNLDAMATKAQQRHMRIAIAEVLPWNNGYPDADPLIQSLNQRIHSIARRHRARVLPFYETLEDPSNPGRMPARWTYEGDHPSIAGYRRLGSLYS
jgi:lysophospholipase L1-like esterase